MTRPTDIFEWAILDVDSEGDPLKAMPPPEIYQTGLLAGEPWARLWHNKMGNNFSLWIQHLAGLSADGGAEPVHTVKYIDTAASLDETEVSALWGGTWIQRGTQAMGTTTVKVFQKTSLT